MTPLKAKIKLQQARTELDRGMIDQAKFTAIQAECQAILEGNAPDDSPPVETPKNRGGNGNRRKNASQPEKPAETSSPAGNV